MPNRVFREGFRIGFIAVIATAISVTILSGSPAQQPAASEPTPVPAISAAPVSGTAIVRAEPDPSTFGRLLPDGTYCGVGVGCPEEDPCLKQEQR